ncbi:MAG: hypothetical protein IRY91_10050, partial [Gemmatimonadaceae bacterium]|nr:hypothetical protein [Gemmatimonadaceae bacterium]
VAEPSIALEIERASTATEEHAAPTLGAPSAAAPAVGGDDDFRIEQLEPEPIALNVTGERPIVTPEDASIDVIAYDDANRQLHAEAPGGAQPVVDGIELERTEWTLDTPTASTRLEVESFWGDASFDAGTATPTASPSAAASAAPAPDIDSALARGEAERIIRFDDEPAEPAAPRAEEASAAHPSVDALASRDDDALGAGQAKASASTGARADDRVDVRLDVDPFGVGFGRETEPRREPMVHDAPPAVEQREPVPPQPAGLAPASLGVRDIDSLLALEHAPGAPGRAAEERSAFVDAPSASAARDAGPALTSPETPAQITDPLAAPEAEPALSPDLERRAVEEANAAVEALFPGAQSSERVSRPIPRTDALDASDASAQAPATRSVPTPPFLAVPVGPAAPAPSAPSDELGDALAWPEPGALPVPPEPAPDAGQHAPGDGEVLSSIGPELRATAAPLATRAGDANAPVDDFAPWPVLPPGTVLGAKPAGTVAEALERIARRIRDGEVVVPADVDPAANEAGALALVLASLLRGRPSR